MAHEGDYIGYVLPDTGTNPVQVWVPDLDGWFGLGEFRTIGENMLNSIGQTELIDMKSNCKYFYLTQELNAGNNEWNSGLGAGTTREYTPLGRENEGFFDLTKGSAKYLYKGRADGESFTMAQSNPTTWMTSVFALDREKGTVPNAGTNYPTGKYVKMDKWQRVLVSKANGGSLGIIKGVLPWTDDYNFSLNAAEPNA